MKKQVTIAVLMFLLPAAGLLKAQSVSDLYQQAENAFNLGRFEQVDSLLYGHLSALDSEYGVRAYRLLALSSLYQDENAKAETYVNGLLAIDPYYTAYGDTPRFADLVEKIKHGKTATITTASQQAETIDEAPVPVTLITEKMIRESNARTVLELLNLYVPGVAIVEGEEANFSMRGMFGYSQEEVLFLLDGVRLNSYNTHSLAPDYRLSIHNIKQIEVLRGSASSLYGNVALSAVVNIITKSGSDVDGLQIDVSGGYPATAEASLMFGKRIADADVLAWASLHYSKGHTFTIAADDPVDGYGLFPQDGNITVGGYSTPPAYDLGLSLKWKHFSLLANHTYGKRSYAYTNLFVPTTYSSEKYGSVFGMSPGRGVASSNINARYSNKWGRWGFEANVFGNHESTTMFNIFGDSIPAFMEFWDGFPWLLPDDDPKNFAGYEEGIFQEQGWKDFNLGANLKAIVDYEFIGHGNFLFGVQCDFFDNYYNDMALGGDFTHVLVSRSNERSSLFVNATESAYSGFFQIKHYFTPTLIFNGGLRYDHKNRYNGVTSDVLSPRIALIWNPTANQNYKISYGRSFVDAPYFYRASKYIYAGNENLNPQYLNNVQLTATIKIPSAHLTYEGNLFYNHVKDIIVLGNDSEFYQNAGVMHTGGFENILSFQYQGWTAEARLYLQKLLKSECIKAEGNFIFSVPNVSARMNLSKEIVKGLTVGTEMYVNGRTQCILPEYVFIGGMPPADAYFNFPPTFLMDIGARYKWSFLEFSVKAKNITNQKYRVGGDRVPVIQEGFSILGGITFHISK